MQALHKVLNMAEYDMPHDRVLYMPGQSFKVF